MAMANVWDELKSAWRLDAAGVGVEHGRDFPGAQFCAGGSGQLDTIVPDRRKQLLLIS